MALTRPLETPSSTCLPCHLGPGNPAEAPRAAPVLRVGEPLALAAGTRAELLSACLLPWVSEPPGPLRRRVPSPLASRLAPAFYTPPACLATPSWRLQEAGNAVVSGIPALSWGFWPPSWLWLSRRPTASTLDSLLRRLWLCVRFSVGRNLCLWSLQSFALFLEAPQVPVCHVSMPLLKSGDHRNGLAPGKKRPAQGTRAADCRDEIQVFPREGQSIPERCSVIFQHLGDHFHT